MYQLILALYFILAFNCAVHSFHGKANYRFPTSLWMKGAEAPTKSKRKSWDWGRFLKTATFYDSLLPKLPFTSKLSSDRVMFKPGDTIWESKNPFTLQWGPLDDVVMGGVSKSDLEPGDRFNGTWKGIVTSENNGGFTGVRTKLLKQPFDLSTGKGILLKVKGDGNRYKFILRDDDNWNGIAWSFSFDTAKNSIKEIKIPFSSLKPTRFARTVDSATQIDSSKITAIQLSLSKFEYDGGLNPRFTEGPDRKSVV